VFGSHGAGLPFSPPPPAGTIGGMSEERKPVYQWIAGLLIGLPVLYVASFGPACGLTEHMGISTQHAWRVYRPLLVLKDHAPTPIQFGLAKYAEICGGFMTYERIQSREDFTGRHSSAK
jgi:hypothetical protein